MKCLIHDLEMEWHEYDDPMIGSGYWWCSDCQDEEEAEYNRRQAIDDGELVQMVDDSDF